LDYGTPQTFFRPCKTAIPFESSNFNRAERKNFRTDEFGTGVAISSSIAAICEYQDPRWRMKFQKMIRIQLMLVVGLGAALLLARPVCAQQDMDPTPFDDSSNTIATDQALNATPSPEAASLPAANSAAPLATKEVDEAGLTSVDTSAVVLLMVSIGSIVLLGAVEAVRGSRRRTWRERAPGSFPTGATAQ
jgi:hypothetical protein